MKLYLLKNCREHDWYTFRGFVIRAENESEARNVAAGRSADEGADTWYSPQYSTCEEIPQNGDSGIVLSDFSAG